MKLEIFVPSNSFIITVEKGATFLHGRYTIEMLKEKEKTKKVKLAPKIQQI